MTTVPSLPAWHHGSDLLTWCQYCRRYHWHGGPAGHRVAHCRTPASPYARSGYELIDAGPAPAALIHDARRSRPVGPAFLGLMEGRP